MVDLVFLLEEVSKCIALATTTSAKECKEYIRRIQYIREIIEKAIADIILFEMEMNNLSYNDMIRIAVNISLNNADLLKIIRYNATRGMLLCLQYVTQGYIHCIEKLIKEFR